MAGQGASPFGSIWGHLRPIPGTPTISWASRDNAGPDAFNNWFFAASAATHTSTGDVTGAGATVAGTAIHYTKHTATGAAQGAGATVAGLAIHPHTSSGAVTGGGAAVAGAAEVFTGATHTSTGDVSGGGATVAGTAAHKTLHTTTGAAQGAGATAAGTATHLTLHTSSGNVQGGGATVAGAATLISLNGGKSSYLRQWLMAYYEAEWAQKDPVIEPPALAPTPVAQAARAITRRTVKAAVVEQKRTPAPYRADPRQAVAEFIAKQTQAVAKKARAAAIADNQSLAALTSRQQQRAAEADEAEEEELLLLAAVL